MRAIIGGTGTGSFYQNLEKRSIITGFGEVEAFVLNDVVFIPRHRAEHTVPPHAINYKAEITALKELGISSAIGIYAIGSISQKIKPGNWGLLSQFVDLSGRGITMFENKAVHTDMTNPFSSDLNRKILESAREVGAKFGPVCDDAIYVQTNGPRLETSAEIRMFSQLGFDVVGMTCACEAVLAREMDIEFSAAAYGINYAAGVNESTEEVFFIDDNACAAIINEMAEVFMNIKN